MQTTHGPQLYRESGLPTYVRISSIDALINMLDRAGLEVDVHVRPKEKGE